MLKEPNLVIYGLHVYNLVFGGVLLKGGCSGGKGGLISKILGTTPATGVMAKVLGWLWGVSMVVTYSVPVVVEEEGSC